MKISIALLFIFLLSQSSLAQTIKLSPTNTDIKFEIAHLKVLSVEGTFDEYEGSLILKGDSLIISGAIQVASINTDNTSRDETLKSEPYFYTERYPEIVFDGKGSKVQEGFIVKGTLSLKGNNTELMFKLLKEEGYLKSSGLIVSRKKIGLSFDSMDQLIGNQVQISIKIEVN